MSTPDNNIVAYDLRGIRAGTYNYNNSTHVISYTNPFDIGNAMTAALGMKYAEGRIYAESALRRYKKKLTGGTISLAVEALTLAVQEKMFGATAVATTVGTATVNGIGYGNETNADYLGVGFYAPSDGDDGSDKFLAVFVRKCLFGPPEMSYKTAGDTINWVTPTTTGEFLSPDKKSDGTFPLMVEFAECENEMQAKNWIKTMLGETVT